MMLDTRVTDDRFLNGRVKLRQFASGHRAGSDAVFLSATIPPDFNGIAVDAGAASGAVGLMSAWRAPQARMRLVEIDPDEARLARDNVVANGLETRAEILIADLLASHRLRADMGICAGDADLVLSNPPFLDYANGHITPDQDRARAHVMPEGGLEKWILGCLSMLKANGILTMIHRADRLDHVLHCMRGRFGEIVIVPLHPRAHDAATRILISGKRNSRAPLRILPALVLHEIHGGFTERAAAIHVGDAYLPLR